MTAETEALRAEVERLRAERDALLKTTQVAYTILADIRHDWRGRHTAEGQSALCAMRDAIAKVTGRDVQDVQDDYTNAALSKVRP